MKPGFIHLTYLILIVVLSGKSILAEGFGPFSPEPDSKKRELVYNPRLENPPKVRIDAASRGVGASSPSLYVLAPDHTGYTVFEQPTLYWYQSQASSAQFELGLIRNDDLTNPILLVNYDPAKDFGLQSINLSDHKVKLAKEVPYLWYVSIIPNPKRRSKDIIARGMIQRIDPPQRLVTNLVKKSKEDLVYILSEEGIWYDALNFISDLIVRHPDKKGLRETRAELLDQGNLPKVAQYDRESQ